MYHPIKNVLANRLIKSVQNFYRGIGAVLSHEQCYTNRQLQFANKLEH